MGKNYGNHNMEYYVTGERQREREKFFCVHIWKAPKSTVQNHDFMLSFTMGEEFKPVFKFVYA